MNEKMFYVLSAAAAVILIAVSVVWPQGEGLPSPPPFGHAKLVPDYYRAQKEKAEREAAQKTQKAADAKRSADLEAAADSASSSSSAAAKR